LKASNEAKQEMMKSHEELPVSLKISKTKLKE
jgi:hypothetical protein